MSREANTPASTPLVGHIAERRLFRRAMESGKLHHAWMIHGRAGTGRTCFAFDAARLLLNGTDPDSRSARQISAGSHPNLLVIRRRMDEKRKKMRQEIVIDDVRPVQDFLHHTAADGRWRVVIVDDAETLNRSAANALLKLLEEPPEDAVFLLTCPSPSSLLPTLRSRCRLLALSPLDDTECDRVLAQCGVDAADRPRLVRQAQGAPGRVLATDLDQDETARRIVASLLEGKEDPESDMLAAFLRHEDGFAILCNLLGEALADRARSLAAQGKLSAASRAADAFSSLQTLRRETERFNLDKNQAARQAAAIASAP
ncbi:DNA/RNA helicase domain-containing protein [Swaminathania salitolerans]|uniref:DNA polymerase III subunit delta n=1 Tax=Swaminathania salitolerans TaxID=182838 RepID=A0A511BNN7_9PROT|nr:DNA/RNA helicase domain-containing protein [Swaminathania salitolerans]GBQ14971.1 DNA polymerase III subunit delta' [Swaminathania salitolerans LMG 21291]GEL01949.1 hypothetical protein SSA02_11120 [Swaminathania salitolerans]